jgi:hypothetical protein
MTALPFKTFEQCGNEPAKPWAIKGVIALGEDSSWFGMPGSLKSALLTDMAVHLAAGRDWRGFKTKQSLGTVYFAFERAALTRRRLAAYRRRDSLANLPIVVVDIIVDLIDESCIEKIVDTVKAAQEQFDIPIGNLIFDTYSKGVAAGGGDEDKAQHANIVAANMKRVHEGLEQPVHIATIGHSGWDGKHERGSSAKLGHVDLSVQIAGETTRTAKIVKGNDQAEGVLTSFAMETVSVGVDEDGEPQNVGILSTVVVAAAPKAPTTQQSLALSALDRVTVSHGQEPPAGSDAPPWVRVVSVDRWREELFRCGAIDRTHKNPRSAFKRIKDGLLAAEQINERDGYVWRAQPGGIKLPLFPPVGSQPIISAPPY